MKWLDKKRKSQCDRGWHTSGYWVRTLSDAMAFRKDEYGDACKYCSWRRDRAIDFTTNGEAIAPPMTIKYEIIYASRR